MALARLISIKSIILNIFVVWISFAQTSSSGDESTIQHSEKERFYEWYADSKESEKAGYGFKLIEQVAGLELEELYAASEKAYFASLEQAYQQEQKELLKEELSRLKPIIDGDKYKTWKEYLHTDSRELFTEIKSYWLLKNPVLQSEYNERLIEHWGRVYNAKKKFIVNNKTGFGSDDRGAIYVKLGSPHAVKKRTVSLSNYTDPLTGSILPIQNNIHFDIEIWYYGELQFVFGISGKGGTYGLQKGILELIPEAGNRPAYFFEPTESMMELSNRLNSAQSDNAGSGLNSSRNSTLLSSGRKRLSRNAASLLLQYTVLEHVADLDPFYLTMYNRMNRDLIQGTLNGSSNAFNSVALTQNLKYKALEINRATRNELKSPVNLSETRTANKFHELNVVTYNFLDRDSAAIQIVFTKLEDHANVSLYLSEQNDGSLSNSIVRRDVFDTFDLNWNANGRQVFDFPLNKDGYSTYNNFTVNTQKTHTLFQSSFVDTSNKQIISSSDLFTIEENLKIYSELKQTGITVSDVVLAEDQKENISTRIPFHPKLTGSFSSGADAILYFEVYGIPNGEQFAIQFGSELSERNIQVRYISEDFVNKIWFKVPLSEKNYPEGKQELKLELFYRGKKVIRTIPIIIQ